MELILKTKIIKKAVSTALSKVIKKKTGYNVTLDIGEFHATTINGAAHVHLILDAELPKEDLEKIIAKIDIL